MKKQLYLGVLLQEWTPGGYLVAGGQGMGFLNLGSRVQGHQLSHRSQDSRPDELQLSPFVPNNLRKEKYGCFQEEVQE